MHFSKCDDAICNANPTSGCRTITVKPNYWFYQDSMGKYTRLSDGDIRGMVYLYGGLYCGRIPSVDFDPPSSVRFGHVDVTISAVPADASIYYTVNGTEPTQSYFFASEHTCCSVAEPAAKPAPTHSHKHHDNPARLAARNRAGSGRTTRRRAGDGARRHAAGPMVPAPPPPAPPQPLPIHAAIAASTCTARCPRPTCNAPSIRTLPRSSTACRPPRRTSFRG